MPRIELLLADSRHGPDVLKISRPAVPAIFTTQKIVMENSIQIDVKDIKDNAAVCNLYACGRCVKIVMRQDDYEQLCRDGFFIRSGKERDNASVLNTTKEYIKEQ